MFLVVVVPVEITIVVVQVPVPGVVCIVLSGTPEVAVSADVVECAVVVAVPAWQACRECNRFEFGYMCLSAIGIAGAYHAAGYRIQRARFHPPWQDETLAGAHGISSISATLSIVWTQIRCVR